MRVELMTAQAVVVAAIVGLWGLAAQAASPEADAPAKRLAAQASARRQAAEDALARHRRQRLDERAKRTRRLQEAYARLADAEQRADEAEDKLTAARQARAEAAPDRQRAALRAKALSRLLGQAADLEPEARDDEPAAFLDAVKRRVSARLQRLDHDTHIHVSDGPVLGRDGRSSPARQIRVGEVATLVVDAEATPSRTGFARADETTPLTGDPAPPIVVGPVLSAEARDALRTVAPGRQGLLPLDVDGALTRVDAEPPATGTSPLEAGGFFVWPIIAVGLLGVLLFGERLWHFLGRPAKPARIAAVIAALKEGDPRRAATLVSPARTDLDRVLMTGIESERAPRPLREQALETALLREEPALERGVNLLGAVAGLAPLLGLLGTVTGMISTFDVISTFGTGNPRLLSGGISVALITTQLGLIVAVPALLAHAWVSRAVARRQALLEEARTALLSIDGSGEAP